jgi:hypothetical protein
MIALLAEHVAESLESAQQSDAFSRLAVREGTSKERRTAP